MILRRLPGSPSEALSLSIVIAALSIAAPAVADECSSLRPGIRPAAAQQIGLFVDSTLAPAIVARATSSWSSCRSEADALPRFRIGRSGTRDLFVRFDPLEIGMDGRCGVFQRRTITLYSHTRTEAGHVVSCGSLAQNLMHELGHALGLADAPRSCTSFAMSKLNSSNAYARGVQRSECRLLAQRWRAHTGPELFESPEEGVLTAEVGGSPSAGAEDPSVLEPLAAQAPEFP